ncbi:unnamed protein product [Prunus armeniaca]
MKAQLQVPSSIPSLLGPTKTLPEDHTNHHHKEYTNKPPVCSQSIHPCRSARVERNERRAPTKTYLNANPAPILLPRRSSNFGAQLLPSLPNGT